MHNHFFLFPKVLVLASFSISVHTTIVLWDKCEDYFLFLSLSLSVRPFVCTIVLYFDLAKVCLSLSLYLSLSLTLFISPISLSLSLSLSLPITQEGKERQRIELFLKLFERGGREKPGELVSSFKVFIRLGERIEEIASSVESDEAREKIPENQRCTACVFPKLFEEMDQMIP